MVNFIQILKKYNVEPMLFLYMIARNLYMPTLYSQLITDKICINHQYNETFCRLINTENNRDLPEATLVFGEAVNLMMYVQWIISFPSVLASIFLGPVMDQFSTAPKIVLLLTIFAALFESTVILLNIFLFELNPAVMLFAHIFQGLTGGVNMFKTAVFTISMKETPLLERTFRFTIIEFALILPNPIANFISSYLLDTEPWHVGHQLRNYFPIYMLIIAIYAISFLYVFFFMGEVKEVIDPNDNILKRASMRTSLLPMSTEYLAIRKSINNMRSSIATIEEHTNSGYEKDEEENETEFNSKTRPISKDSNNNRFTTIDLKEPKSRSQSLFQPLPPINRKSASFCEIFRSLFELKNATQMVKCTLKRREHNLHILLWLSIVIYMVQLFFSNGMPLIMPTFVQKTYGWEASHFMFIDAYGNLAFGLISTFCLFFFHKFDLQDSITIIIGLSSLFLINVFRGFILSPWGLYISYVTGSLYLCSVVACRGFVAKIVAENEIGSLMSALSVGYASSPVVGSFIYTQLWRISMDSFKGLAFIVAALCLSIIIGLAIYLHIGFKKYTAIKDRQKTTSTKY